jgi:ActR/RegA family two-component response regulator/tetratricopeptide (TPR) repeat protein
MEDRGAATANQGRSTATPAAPSRRASQPRAQQHARRVRADGDVAGGLVTAERLLLIADDADPARRPIDGALDQAGFTVRRVATGEEGLAYLATNVVAGIVLDQRRPFADGLHLLRRIRERALAAPVVMISSAGSVELAVKAVKAGAADVIEWERHAPAEVVGRVRAALAESPTRLAPRGVVRPVFVGREPELCALDEELAGAIAGEGRIALIAGDEGIGKTSLALEVARRARGRGCTVLWGQCHEAAGAPAYWPWIQILRRYVTTADLAVLQDDLDASTAAVGWITPMLRERCPELPAPAPAELTRFHVVDGVTQFLKRAAARRPLVLVLDDLHRADGDSLHLLRFLATESADAALLVLGAYRDGGADDSIAAALARVAAQPLATLLRLGGFEVADVRRYVEEATAALPSEALVRAIHTKTAGHPLFVAEVTRLLAAGERLTEDPVSGELRLAIPATRRQALANRLAGLSSGCRRLLGVAAVIGPDFTADLLASVAGETPTALRDALDEAAAEQLVAASQDEPGTYRFGHVLVRDVLYEDLDLDARRSLHGRVGAELEVRMMRGALPRAAEPLGLIAHHSVEAVADEEDRARALGWVVRAGDHSAAMMAHEEAARHYVLALRVVAGTSLAAPARMSELCVKLAEARWRAGDMIDAREAGREALAHAHEAADPVAIATAALTFAGRLPGFGAIVSEPEVVRELEQALALLPSTATALRALAMARLAEELAYSPHPTSERSLAQEAIELARGLGDPVVLATVLRTTQWSVWTPDAVERRRRLAAEIVALAERTRDRVLALDGQLLRLWSALEHGETDAAWGQLELCARLAGDLRLPHYVWVTATARACLHLATGRLDEAELLAERASEAGASTGSPTVALFAGAQRTHVQSLRGRFDDVDAWLRGMLTHAPLLAATMECALTLTRARAGQHERARAALAALAAEDFARVPRTPGWLTNMVFLASACTIVGDADSARRLYARLAPFTPYNVVLPPVFVLAPVAHYMAGLASLVGNAPAARRHYEDALALAQRTGSRQCVASTQIAYGRLLLGSPGRPEAERGARLLAAGRALAEELGLEPAVREAAAALTLAPPPAAGRALFRREQDAWEVEFRGERATVPHRVGMTYLRCLLERPGVPVGALELAGLGGDATLVDRQGGPLIDRQAMTEVQGRLAAIEADIAACERRSAVAGAELLHERAECMAYLAGRGPELVSAAERARSCVTKAIGRAIGAIRRAHEGFGHHLARHVETGRLCVYVPDPAAPVSFEL